MRKELVALRTGLILVGCRWAALAEIKNAYVGDFEKVAALMERIEHAEDDDALRLDMLRKQIEFRNHEGQGIGFTLDKKSTFESGPL